MDEGWKQALKNFYEHLPQEEKDALEEVIKDYKKNHNLPTDSHLNHAVK